MSGKTKKPPATAKAAKVSAKAKSATPAKVAKVSAAVSAKSATVKAAATSLPSEKVAVPPAADAAVETAAADPARARRDKILSVLSDGKAEAMTVLSTQRQSNGLFAYMVIATAGSARHAAALTQRLKTALKAGGGTPPAVETAKDGDWTLLDCGDIVVHIMSAAAREYYRIETLWGFNN